MTAVQLSAASVEHYTPLYLVNATRAVLGGIDMDPASCEEANLLVQAEFIYTKQDNGLMQPWAGKVLLNPPGNTKKDRVKPPYPVQFWSKLVKEWQEGNVECAIYIGYSLQILQTILAAGCEVHPLDLPTCLFSRRIAFDYWEDGVRKHSRAPTHANFATLLPSLEDVDGMTQRFDQHFVPFGRRMG